MNKDFFGRYLNEVSNIMSKNKDYLIDLDSVVGDGDLGLTMSDGFLAAHETFANDPETDLGKLLYNAGKAMANKVPSTMGTLMASGFMQAGKMFRGKEVFAPEEITDFFSAFAEGVEKRGKAKVGEKTFLDGLYPAVEAFKEGFQKGLDLKQIGKAAKEAAFRGYEATKDMLAVHGRAAIRGEASKGLADPGAMVAALLLEALEITLNN